MISSGRVDMNIFESFDIFDIFDIFDKFDIFDEGSCGCFPNVAIFTEAVEVQNTGQQASIGKMRK